MMAWWKAVLSESDGTPSASRVVMFMWSFSLIAAFLGFGAWEAWHTNRMPSLGDWAGFLAAAQGSGSIGYAANQVREAVSQSSTQTHDITTTRTETRVESAPQPAPPGQGD